VKRRLIANAQEIVDRAGLCDSSSQSMRAGGTTPIGKEDVRASHVPRTSSPGSVQEVSLEAVVSVEGDVRSAIVTVALPGRSEAAVRWLGRRGERRAVMSVSLRSNGAKGRRCR
jgi:hypothetical protein